MTRELEDLLSLWHRASLDVVPPVFFLPFQEPVAGALKDLPPELWALTPHSEKSLFVSYPSLWENSDGTLLLSDQLHPLMHSPERPEIQERNDQRAELKPLPPVPCQSGPNPPLSRRVQVMSELVKITSLGAGRNAGSSDSVSLSTGLVHLLY